jgi:sensor histidine kinase YesM
MVYYDSTTSFYHSAYIIFYLLLPDITLILVKKIKVKFVIMKSSAIFNVLDLRKPVSHIAFLILSLAVAVIMPLIGKTDGTRYFSLGVFIMIFLQLEIFIYLGTKLFADLNFDKSPGEITRIVAFRFTVFLAGCMVFSLIIFIILQYVFLWASGEDLSRVMTDFIETGFRLWFKSTIKGLSFGAAIFTVLLWQTSLQREQKLREEKLIFQNETLKNQVNPHFLFNSLNTLSSLISGRPEIAEEFIQRLSSIYRYILEYSSRERVPLSTELAFIRDYFYLHQIRDDGKIQLEINAVNENSEILPVSLQILVENAIKHNKATRENPLIISIGIEDNFVVVRNNLQKMGVQLRSTGIGLKNLSQRINLVSQKDLIIQETSSEFIVKIPLL